MSEEPEVSDETPEKPAEAVTDEELDDVAGAGAGSGTGKLPIKDDASFVSFPPQFIKVMSYHDAGGSVSNAAGRSVSDLFAQIATDPTSDE